METVENFCTLMVRSKLRTPDAVKSVQQRWKAEAKDSAASVQHFARWLVSKQVLTEYQVTLLLKGKSEGFFLNHYQILDRLGMGRMAGVFKGVHASGQVVAIKVLPPSKAKNAEMLARFKREAGLAMRLKHPNVVRAFQTGKSSGLNFLVMEYLDGETVEDVIKRRKSLPAIEAVRLVHQAFMGLQYIHEMNMVHRDLKPANLMVVPAPAKGEPDNTLRATIKVLDIGLGREFFDEDEQNQNAELTAEGAMLGTPDYMAPEQARDSRKIDIRADIYSLGCVLYHQLTGQPPFPNKNLVAQMISHAKDTPRALREFNPAIPDAVQQIMNMLLAKQPDQRYTTPEKAAQALQAFLKGDTAQVRREEGPAMKRYLTWLETTPESEDVDVVPVVLAPAPAGKAPAAAPPMAVPVAAPPAGKVPAATLAPKSAPAAAASDLDVEVVSPGAPVGKPWLSHRDMILLGSGAAVIGLLILGVLITVLLMRN